MQRRHIMSGSRGKGSRRVPWRDGRRRRRPPPWRKQAMHAVDGVAEVGEAVARFPLQGLHGEKPAHLIYRLDQAMARAGIAYDAEYRGRWEGFRLFVPAEHREQVRELLARLQARA